MRRLVLAAGLLLASPAAADEASPRPPRVTVVIDTPGPVPGEIAEELQAHVRPTHPGVVFSQLLGRGSPASRAETLRGALAERPEVLLTLGAPVFQAVPRGDRNGVELLFLALPEHQLRSLEARGPVGSGVVAGCPLDALLRLARQLGPAARRMLWVLPREDGPQGPLLAAARAAAGEVGLQLDPADAAPGEREPLAQAARASDGAILPYPPTDNELRREIIQAVVGAGRPLFACDSASVGAGATAGLTTDPQRLGEVAGQLTSDALDHRLTGPTRPLVEGAVVVLNRRSACLAGVTIPAGMAERGVVYEKSHVCAAPPPPPPAPARLPRALGGVALAAAGLLALLARQGRRAPLPA
jgi:ABC-type uncharacterized transport system substrate-binding protein